MKYLSVIILITLLGCGRDNDKNYSCSPELLEKLSLEAKECSQETFTTYEGCLTTLKFTFCKY